MFAFLERIDLYSRLEAAHVDLSCLCDQHHLRQKRERASPSSVFCFFFSSGTTVFTIFDTVIAKPGPLAFTKHPRTITGTSASLSQSKEATMRIFFLACSQNSRLPYGLYRHIRSALGIPDDVIGFHLSEPRSSPDGLFLCDWTE